MTLTNFLNQNLRALVTLMFSFTFCYGFAAGRLDVAAFAGVAGAVISFWFGAPRDPRRATDPDPANGVAPPMPEHSHPLIGRAGRAAKNKVAPRKPRKKRKP